MLETNSEYLRPEIMDVLRAFDCEEENFTHYFSYGKGKFFNSIEYKGEFYDFEDEFETENEILFKRYAKRFAKLAFYKVLSKFKGELVWGALTGVRPTKLAYAEIAAGREPKKLFKDLKVSDNKAELCLKVVETQRELYRNRGGQNLYISIPFCPTKCDYCSFITAPIALTRKYLEEYLSSVIEEIKSARSYITRLKSIYIGGGTPYVLSAKELERLLFAVRETYPEKCEFTIEAGRPDVFDREKLELSKKYGATRICVNPQSFNDSTLKKIGRAHTADDILRAYALSREYDFDINLDLIAGLADEGTEDFAYSLNKAIELNPENITVHTLSLKSGANLKERVKKLSVNGIGEMIELSVKALSANGYFPYYLYRQKYQAGGLENVGWCKENKACVYNVDVMEEIADNVAVGANAISKRLFCGGERIERCASPKDIPTYISKCESVIRQRRALFEEPDD